MTLLYPVQFFRIWHPQRGRSGWYWAYPESDDLNGPYRTRKEAVAAAYTHDGV